MPAFVETTIACRWSDWSRIHCRSTRTNVRGNLRSLQVSAGTTGQRRHRMHCQWFEGWHAISIPCISLWCWWREQPQQTFGDLWYPSFCNSLYSLLLNEWSDVLCWTVTFVSNSYSTQAMSGFAIKNKFWVETFWNCSVPKVSTFARRGGRFWRKFCEKKEIMLTRPEGLFSSHDRFQKVTPPIFTVLRRNLFCDYVNRNCWWIIC